MTHLLSAIHDNNPPARTFSRRMVKMLAEPRTCSRFSTKRKWKDQPVRTFCFIFIVYVVFLLTQPCQDLTALGVNRCENDTLSVHVERSPAPSQDDECLPFCICSCCSHPVANVVFTLSLSTETKVAVTYSNLIEYPDPDSQTYPNSIWQPPKA